MENEEDILKKYNLSKEEHDKIGKQIIELMLKDKYPVKNPKAIINIAPPASGKTGLNAYSYNQFKDGNVVIINSDELKPFHPKIEEIAKLYPQYYTKITDQESNTWTSNLFDTVLKEGYNVIFEGTGKNSRILGTISEKMNDYDVVVRGMAVSKLNCLMSILERYEYQVQTKGWGRLVVLDHFEQTYKGMPETINEIEKSKIVSAVEVYKRGTTPFEPQLIYNSLNIKDFNSNNAKYSVLQGRNEDGKKALVYYKKHQDFFNILKNKNVPALNQILNSISDIVQKQTGER